jgi:uncharacterized protein YjbJ (UPF0337 family)
MDWDRVEGNWKQLSRVKEKWGNLSDDDLDRVGGRRDQLEGVIQERYGIAKDQVRRDIDVELAEDVIPALLPSETMNRVVITDQPSHQGTRTEPGFTVIA